MEAGVGSFVSMDRVAVESFGSAKNWKSSWLSLLLLMWGPEGGMSVDGVWRGVPIAVEWLEEASRWDLEWRLELEDPCQSVLWRVAVELLPRTGNHAGCRCCCCCGVQRVA